MKPSPFLLLGFAVYACAGFLPVSFAIACPVKGKPAERIEKCTRTIATDRTPRSLERAFRRRGNAFFELGEYARAAEDFSALILINPRIAGYFDNRLNTYRALGRPSDALRDAEQAVRLAGNQAFVYRSRGLVYGDLNRLDLAIADFSTAISYDPANAGLYIDRGKFFVRASRLREGVEDFGRALQVDGRAFEAYRERGLALSRLGDLEGALADLVLFSRAQPGDADVERAMQELLARTAAPSPNPVPSQPPAPPAAPPPPRTSDADQRRENDKVSTGTGFFVSQDGHLVSNAHVVKGCVRAQVRYGLSEFHEASIVARDSANDLAIIKTDIRPQAVAAVRGGVRVGENVAAYGYPLSGLLSSGGNFTVGNVSALSGMRDDTRFIQISAAVQPGNSGGPVLDQSGNVVGVVVSKLDVIKLAELTSDVAQNVNFAIKSNVLASFLDSTGIAYATTAATTALAAPDLAERGKQISALIRCRP